MKTLILLISFFSLNLCKAQDQKDSHQKLINWINEGNFKVGQGKVIKDDSVIIRILERYTALDTISAKGKKIYSKIMSDDVGIDDATLYYKVYMNRQDSIKRVFRPITDTFKMGYDITEAVILDLEHLQTAMQYHFGNRLWNTLQHKDIGFAVYPANYGQKGRLVDHSYTDKYKTSILIQLVERDSQNSNKWNVLGAEVWDFGGLKPPKIIYGGLTR